MTEFNDIDDLFRKNKNDWNGPPKLASWEALSGRLEEHSNHKIQSRKNTFRWLGAACVVALLGMTVFFINQKIMPKSNLANLEEVVFPENNANVSDSNDSENTALSSNEMVNQKAIGNATISNKNKASRIPLAPEFAAHQNSGMDNDKSASTIDKDEMITLSEVREMDYEPSAGYPYLEETVSASKPLAVSEAESIEEDLDNLKYNDATVYSNRVGTTFKKEEHEMLLQESKKEVPAKTKTQQSVKKDVVEKSTASKAPAESTVTQSKAIDAKASGYNAYIAIPKSIKVVFPLGDKYACDFANIFIDEQNYRVEYCQFKSQKVLTDNAFLSDFYQLNISQLQAIGKAKQANCTSGSTPQQISIMVQYGFQNQPEAETVVWNWSDDCTSTEVYSYVLKFKKLLNIK
jgi:hypothetical protein